jgi:hypothetical protein
LINCDHWFVARWGEFCSLGRHFSGIAEVAQFLGFLFFHGECNVSKNGFGYIFGDFFTLDLDRCYDFKNIFAENFSEKIGVFDSKQS